MKAIARLFADMGDSYVELIATGNRFCYVLEAHSCLHDIVFSICFFPWFLVYFLGSDESMLIVHALLEVTSHPEYDIASMTFNFWHSLQLNLTKRLFILSPLVSTMILLDHKHIDSISLKANFTYISSNIPEMLIFLLAMMLPLKLRGKGGYKSFVQFMSHLYP